jgi:hypothetical protein
LYKDPLPAKHEVQIDEDARQEEQGDWQLWQVRLDEFIKVVLGHEVKQ